MARTDQKIETEESHTQDQSGYVFSIATPAVTVAPVYSEDISDTSYIHPPTASSNSGNKLHLGSDLAIANKSSTERMDLDDLEGGQIVGTIEITNEPTSEPPSLQQSLENRRVQDNTTTPDTKNPPVGDSTSAHEMKVSKRRAKLNKKSSKLDAKSKLEKSRQSARECRARKKLRYQYLEDLVNNREKAVIKLRKQLTTFCDLSKKPEMGALREAARIYSSSCVSPSLEVGGVGKLPNSESLEPSE